MKISLVGRIRLKKVLKYSALLIVLTFCAGAIATNFFGKQAATNAFTPTAAFTYIGPNDNSHDADNIIINNGKTVAIDGTHNFRNLTVNNGGVLTTTDYNTYGIDGMHFEQTKTLDNSRQAPSLTDTGRSGKAVFIMRGFIYTKGGHYEYRLGTKTGNISTFSVDDKALLRFYDPISTIDYENQTYWSGTPTGRVRATIASNSSTSWIESDSDASNPIVPFELLAINIDARFKFGILACTQTQCLPTNGLNAFNLNTVHLGEEFNGAAIPNPGTLASQAQTPQMMTVKAWQRYNTSDALYQCDASTADCETDLDAARRDGGTNYANFYYADNYDFSLDPKVYLQNNTDILLNPTTIPSPICQDNSTVALQRTTARYFEDDRTCNNGWSTPLAVRAPNIDYPVVSQSLFTTLHNLTSSANKLTILRLSGDLTVQPTGQINLNGKGFSPNRATDRGDGVGPGSGYGGRGITNDRASSRGGSHSGVGGEVTDTGKRYDIDQNAAPLLPGSSGGVSANYLDNNRNYGGGFISISAHIVNLFTGSKVVANAFEGQVDNPASGASGGSIFLSDTDASSAYDGFITAIGASTDEAGGEYKAPGGGGGHIRIETNLPKAMLDAYWRTNQTATCNRSFWGTDFGNCNFLSTNRIISAAGGYNFNDVGGTSYGKYGIVSIKGLNLPISVKKWLTPVSRVGLTAAETRVKVNPYAVRPGDVINVHMGASALEPGQQTTITDEVFHAPGTPSYTCVPNTLYAPIAGTTFKMFDSGDSETTTPANASYVTFTFTPTITTAEVSYECSVVQNP